MTVRLHAMDVVATVSKGAGVTPGARPEIQQPQVVPRRSGGTRYQIDEERLVANRRLERFQDVYTRIPLSAPDCRPRKIGSSRHVGVDFLVGDIWLQRGAVE